MGEKLICMPFQKRKGNAIWVVKGDNMLTYKGKTALITGASMGIGEVFARTLAGRGAHVVLVARSRDKLEALAAELSRRHEVRAEAIAVDLTERDATRTIMSELTARNITVDLLINNAGFASYGRFETIARERQEQEIMLNCVALADLTRALLPGMLERRDGAIVNVASTAAFQPLPYMAVYGATKAFVLSFSEALWAENRERGVRVLALCPGATETPFFDVVAAPEASVGKREKPELVVARALHALEAGRPYVISGRRNYLLAHAGRFMPRATVARATARVLQPRSRPLPSAPRALALPTNSNDSRR